MKVLLKSYSDLFKVRKYETKKLKQRFESGRGGLVGKIDYSWQKSEGLIKRLIEFWEMRVKQSIIRGIISHCFSHCLMQKKSLTQFAFVIKN